jgi:hypothetical protein
MFPDYEISIPHFYCLEYRENDRVMLMEIDFRDSVIYLNEALVTNWEAPYSHEGIEVADKTRILSNVHDYLARKRGFHNVILEC